MRYWLRKEGARPAGHGGCHWRAIVSSVMRYWLRREGVRPTGHGGCHWRAIVSSASPGSLGSQTLLAELQADDFLELGRRQSALRNEIYYHALPSHGPHWGWWSPPMQANRHKARESLTRIRPSRAQLEWETGHQTHTELCHFVPSL